MARRSTGRVQGAEQTPRWDADRRELWLGDVLVKRYTCPAPSQEYLLAALEESGWHERLDDPLPRGDGKDSKRRLREAVRNLSRCQNARLLRFEVEPDGRGVRWRKIFETGYGD